MNSFLKKSMTFFFILGFGGSLFLPRNARTSARVSALLMLKLSLARPFRGWPRSNRRGLPLPGNRRGTRSHPNNATRQPRLLPENSPHFPEGGQFLFARKFFQASRKDTDRLMVATIFDLALDFDALTEGAQKPGQHFLFKIAADTTATNRLSDKYVQISFVGNDMHPAVYRAEILVGLS